MIWWAFIVLALTAPIHALPQAQLVRRSSWLGWKSIETIFSFGDSYTSSGFKINGTQPSPGNPFGNPSLDPSKDFLGAKWISYLTTQYNESLINTFDFACGGATVNGAFITRNSRDIITQITQDFIPNYGSKRDKEWKSDNTLFTFFIGINDVGLSAKDTTKIVNWVQIFQSYSAEIEKLRQAGAKNILFLAVPPLERAPGGNPTLAQQIPDWNKRLKQVADELSNHYDDIKVFYFETDVLFNKILDNPSSFEETKVIFNTWNTCPEFGAGKSIPSKDHHAKGCDVSYQQHFWRDELHVTFSVHEAIAAQVAVKLREG